MESLVKVFSWILCCWLRVVLMSDVVNSKFDLTYAVEIWQPPASCKCIPFYQCLDNGTINTAGVKLLDFRMGSSCLSSLDICCVDTGEKGTLPISEVYKVQCGLRNPKGVGFKTVGSSKTAQFGEFPWMIALFKKKHGQADNNIQYICGGSLIHHKVVLTAAHCVVGEEGGNLWARAGEWDFKINDEHIPHEDRLVQKIIIHEKFSSGTGQNDIALLILVNKFNYANNIYPVCLPQQGEHIQDEKCIMSGWGKDSFGKDGRLQEILKQVTMPIVPQNECEDAISLARSGRSRFKLQETLICAGKNGADSCEGDGGSPLVCPVNTSGSDEENNIYQQVGIVSWGIGCGGNTPGVYANVAHFIDWIHDETKKHDISIE